MFHKNLKIVLAIILFGFSVYNFYLGNIGNGIFLLLLVGLPILLYFKNEVLIMAFFKLRKQDMDGAKEWLDRIKNPEGALVKKQLGYYNYLYGLITYQSNFLQSEKFFRKAVTYGLNMGYDEAMARLSLAGIMAHKRRKREAIEFVNQAKKLDKENILKDQIKLIQEQLKKI